MPTVPAGYSERACQINYMYRLRLADGLPIPAELAEEFALLSECVMDDLASYYTAATALCGR